MTEKDVNEELNFIEVFNRMKKLIDGDKPRSAESEADMYNQLFYQCKRYFESQGIDMKKKYTAGNIRMQVFDSDMKLIKEKNDKGGDIVE